MGALDWLSPERRRRSALTRGCAHLSRREYLAAYRALGAALPVLEGADAEFIRGLRHLAAAGYKRVHNDERGAQRQLAHAKRRLEAFRPRYRGLDVDELLRCL